MYLRVDDKLNCRRYAQARLECLRFGDLGQCRHSLPLDKVDHQLGVIEHRLDKQFEEPMIIPRRDGRMYSESVSDSLFSFLSR